MDRYHDESMERYAWELGIGKAQTYHIVIMCRFPEEMKLGSIGTTGEGRDIKVEENKKTNICKKIK